MKVTAWQAAKNAASAAAGDETRGPWRPARCRRVSRTPVGEYEKTAAPRLGPRLVAQHLPGGDDDVVACVVIDESRSAAADRLLHSEGHGHDRCTRKTRSDPAFGQGERREPAAYPVGRMG